MGRKRTKEPVSLKASRLGARIFRAMEKRGWTTYDVEEESRRAGNKISHQTVSNYIGGQHDPDDPRSRRTLTLLANLLQDSFGISGLKLDSKDTVAIRIEGRVAAGRPIEFLEGDETVSVDPAYIRVTGDVTALRVSGDSMVDQHILDGDILICRKAPEPTKGTTVVVDFKGQRGAAVKRWERKGGMIYLSADRYARDEDKQSFHDWEVGKVLELLGLIRRLT